MIGFIFFARSFSCYWPHIANLIGCPVIYSTVSGNGSGCRISNPGPVGRSASSGIFSNTAFCSYRDRSAMLSWTYSKSPRPRCWMVGCSMVAISSMVLFLSQWPGRMPGPASLLSQTNKQKQEKNTQINKKKRPGKKSARPPAKRPRDSPPCFADTAPGKRKKPIQTYQPRFIVSPYLSRSRLMRCKDYLAILRLPASRT